MTAERSWVRHARVIVRGHGQSMMAAVDSSMKAVPILCGRCFAATSGVQQEVQCSHKQAVRVDLSYVRVAVCTSHSSQ
eukprot:46595-Eustigmatos_ZCMA.PRE.1